MTPEEKRTTTACQLVEAKLREVHPALDHMAAGDLDGEDARWVRTRLHEALVEVVQVVRDARDTAIEWDNETREIAREFYGEEEEEGL